MASILDYKLPPKPEFDEARIKKRLAPVAEFMEGAAHGKRYGIIAQDLEKSDMGKSLVMDTPNGKMIDTNQTVGALLAAVSHLNKRLEKAGK